MKGKRWTRHETLVALRYYFRTPFGRLHERNPEIIAIAERFGRTPGSVAMKLCNFAGCDPSLPQKGLSNASQLDRHLFAEMLGHAEQTETEIDSGLIEGDPIREVIFPLGWEAETRAKARRGQDFFRSAVRSNFEGRCALTALNVEPLLVASHIIPWSHRSDLRCDPRNGLLLNALHDRAFDCGLITFDDKFRLQLSPVFEDLEDGAFHREMISGFQGIRLREATKFAPSRESLEYHRTHIFQN